jgi:ABC-type transport system substrate-binding protein
MREKTVLMALAFTAIMLLMLVPVPVGAWEYVGGGHDTLTERFGPRADHVQIIMYKDELAEFTALEQHQIDVTDWPVDADHYVAWTKAPMNGYIDVVDTGPEFGMYILDMRMNNETRIYQQIGPEIIKDLGPNPAYTAPFGNPMADIWLRRAIAACIDRKYVVQTIVSGGHEPWLGTPLYTVSNDPPYLGWGHPELNPTGALREITYVKEDGSANVTLGNRFLDEHGYTIVGGKRTKNGVAFQIEIVVRQDHTYRKLFGEDLYGKMMAAPPNGLGLDVKLTYKTSAGARSYVMADKWGHMYTGGWGLSVFPDHLYYLFHINNYYHPGRPMNYMYYPGDYAQITVPYDGWQYNYTNVPELRILVDWGTTSYYLDLSDYDKTWKAGDKVWKNPQNYWSWELMTATTDPRAVHCARKSQEAMTALVVGEPVWASRSFTAYHKTYTGPESYKDKPWKGVVNEAGLGVWSWWSFYNMHTWPDVFGDDTMTIRWGFRQPTMSLNPIYAEWVWDWYVLNKAYDSLLTVNPYATSENVPQLATSWKVETWDASELGLGTCTKITFHVRHDVYWSDGVPLTASDIVFTWGGRKVPGSLSNLLYKNGYPPAYWDGQIADILSVAAPDPWTVIVYLDVYAYFGLYSMSGFNIVLPEHVWKPIIEGKDPLHPDPTLPWNQPCVGSGPWHIRSTAEPTVDIWLDKNPWHYQYRNPINIWTYQHPTTYVIPEGTFESIGQTHWLTKDTPTYPLTGPITVDLFIHTKYVYETGPYSTDVYPRTKLDGIMNVSLWKWNGTDCPNLQWTTYDKIRDILGPNAPWEAERCNVIQIPLNIGALPGGYYYIRVDLKVTSLAYFDGSTWVTVSPTDNPFNGFTTTYKEFIVVTLRTDIGGLFWKPCDEPAYQPIADIKVDMMDVYAAAYAYGSYPGHPRWNPSCDVNNDLKVDMLDYYRICAAYGWIPPP